MLALGLLAACRRAPAALVVPGRAAVALSGGPNASLTYAARTDAGVVLVDLGWWGHARPLRRALAALDARPGDVRHVFLTHAHRDHVAAWPAVRAARVHLAAAEVPALVGAARPRARLVRWAERVRPPRRPAPGALALAPFSADTVIVLGADTLRAYLVPGHTAGSAVYLFRGILFLGDAVTRRPLGGYAPAAARFSDDRAAARRALAALWPRLPPDGVRLACTAHAHCTPFDARFRAAVSR